MQRKQCQLFNIQPERACPAGCSCSRFATLMLSATFRLRPRIGGDVVRGEGAEYLITVSISQRGSMRLEMAEREDRSHWSAYGRTDSLPSVWGLEFRAIEAKGRPLPWGSIVSYIYRYL